MTKGQEQVEQQREEIGVVNNFSFDFLTDIEEETKPIEKNSTKSESNEEVEDEVVEVENSSLNRSAQETNINREAYLKNVSLGIWEEIDETDIDWTDDKILEEINKVAIKDKNKLSATEEFQKNGGNIDELIDLRIKEKSIENIYNHIADENSEKSEEAKFLAIREKYSKVGWSDSKILKQIELWKKTEGEDKDTMFDDEAFQAIDEIKENVKIAIDAKINAAKKAFEEKEQKRKEYAETLKSKVEDKAEAKEIYKDFLSYDDTGLTNVDRIYLQMRNNPETAIALYKFLKDPEKFINSKVKKEVSEAVIERATKITLAPKKEKEIAEFSAFAL